MSGVELGVFLPVASNGFLFSRSAPSYQPTFELQRQIATLAEDIGLDYVFSMGKWKGFGGDTGFWEQSLEPLTLASALAAQTQRIKLIATVSPLLLHPTVAAKMINTVDEVSGGRFGINIVTGNTLDEYEQMGIVPDGYNQERYAYAEEWLHVLKLLWTQEKVTFDGKYFHLVECVSAPKPVSEPHPFVVCAGLSDQGLAFTAREADYAFVGVVSPAVGKVKALAADLGREIKTCTNLFIVQDDTDEAAHARFNDLRAQRDDEALDNLIASFVRDGRSSYAFRTHYLRTPDTIGFGNGTPVVGSARTIAEGIAKEIVDGGIDSVQFIFVDYLEGLARLRAEVLPLLAEILDKEDVHATPGSTWGRA